MPDDILHLSLRDLSRLVRRKEISPPELLRQTLSRIEQVDKQLNSYITVMVPSAEEEARSAEKEILRGRYRGPLHGLPVAIKDMFATRGVRTTCGSKVLRDWVPDEDATAVARLRAAGAVIVGKTNMHEFSYGVTSDNPHFGPVHNPWDLQRVPGGSSGGSAAAVATSLCAAALGSDTGGSIRIPAALCGVVGLKPTYGRISRFGAIPLAWSIDHVGPIAKSVPDAAILLEAIAGADPQDPTSSREIVPHYLQALARDVRGVRVGIPRDYFFDHIDAEILGAVRAAIGTLQELGARAVEVSIPHLENCAAMEAHITLAEATSYHEHHLETQANEYGTGVRTNLEAGRYLLATDYVKSQRARGLLHQALAEVFRQADVLVVPTLPAFPPRIGEVYVQSGDLREHVVDAFLRFNIPFNLTGLPAISVPCGFSSSGLPIGLQIAGKALDEATVLRVAHAYESHQSAHRRRPAVILPAAS
jgi:aspartyl-tRNA(Asn)/glutamyl-tRNA(Gln) amidotransferase subunit A